MAFLSHVVSTDGIQVDPKKIEAILEWPRSTIVMEVRYFLSFSRLLQEINDGIFQNSSTFDKASSEKCQVYLAWQMREHF